MRSRFLSNTPYQGKASQARSLRFRCGMNAKAVSDYAPLELRGVRRNDAVRADRSAFWSL